MPLAAVAAIGAIGSIAGGAIAASGASSAASTQANAALQAAQIQAQSQQEALQFQEAQYNQGLNLANPFLQTGYSAETNLANLLGILPQSAYSSPIPQPQPINVIPGQGGQTGTSGNALPFVPINPGASLRSPQMDASARIPSGGQTIGVPGGARGTPPAATLGPQHRAAPATLSSLINPSLGASGSLLTPFQTPFQAPTNVTEQNDPGYKFRLQQGINAIQNSAAASGDLLSGNTLQGLTQFGQDYGSNEYGNVYNRALQQYLIPQQNALSRFNLLSGLASGGQQQVGSLSNLGALTAGNVGNTLVNSSANIGRTLQTGAANASGYSTGAANAWGNTLAGLGNYASLPFLMQYLNGGGGSTAGVSMSPTDPSWLQQAAGAIG